MFFFVLQMLLNPLGWYFLRNTCSNSIVAYLQLTYAYRCKQILLLFLSRCITLYFSSAFLSSGH